MLHRKTAAVGLAAVACVAVAACSSSGGGSKSGSGGSNPLAGSSSNGTVVVGSANFPEDELLAQIYADVLQGVGVDLGQQFVLGEVGRADHHRAAGRGAP